MFVSDEHQATIQKLVKQGAKPDKEWSCFSIKKMKDNIGKFQKYIIYLIYLLSYNIYIYHLHSVTETCTIYNFRTENCDRGMKMLVRLCKNPNASLHSDIEEKGKGKRIKKTNKRFAESDKENNIRKKNQMLSLVPKLSDFSQRNHELVNKDATIDESSERRALSPLNNLLSRSNSSHIKPTKDLVLIEKQTSKPVGTIKGEEAITSDSKGCKVRNIHKCAYTEEGEVTLQTLANALCHMNSMLTM